MHANDQPKIRGLPPVGAGRTHADPWVRGYRARGLAQHRGGVRAQHLPLRATVHGAAL